MKKTVAIILAILTAFSLFSSIASAEATPTKAKDPLKFNEDGSFKIMQIADIQDVVLFRPLTRMFITDLLEKEKPDLVVLTGDNIAPGSGQLISWLIKKNIDNFMKIFENKKVPVAIVYGNHDADRNCLTKEEQWEIYEKYDCFIGVRDSEELTGYGTYYLPVNASDSDKHKFTLWFFDSQERNTENDLGGYGCVAKDQINWYVRTEKAITAANGGNKIPSFAFQHIIIPEIYDVLYKVGEVNSETGEITELEAPGAYLKEQTITEDGIVYGFPEEYADEDTFLSETCCPPKYSNGQADALVDNGNVLGIAVGHDHVNCFVIPYKGLDIVQTPTSSFGSYGDINRGARVITLNENDLTDYETEMIYFREYYDLSDKKLYNRYVFNSECDDFTIKDRLVAMVKYIFS
ncbi:MAG: hypothetical protein E7544_06960 [Ruminococcaceae bacterium]|nr:hypothetical protein [Oscillospiraceae bacterium]